MGGRAETLLRFRESTRREKKEGEIVPPNFLKKVETNGLERRWSVTEIGTPGKRENFRKDQMVDAQGKDFPLI